MSPLKSTARIRNLAIELGLAAYTDPLRAILVHCEKQVKAVLQEFPHCVTPGQLLDALANKLGTHFEVVRTDAELRQIQKRYLNKGEKGFVRLEEELRRADVYGITIKLKQRELWEPDFVSVIDCRGDKACKENYTKWHEIGHLLILADNNRSAFRRTHCSADMQDAEEALVEVIAGKFAFWSEMIRSHISGTASFDLIEKIRQKVSPEASRQSALIGIVKAWPDQLLLVRAELGLRKSEERALRQRTLGFDEAPQPVLRAVHVSASDPAKDRSFTIHQNMRVPKGSVIYRVFETGSGSDEAVENLSSWESSDGTMLPPIKVSVSARFNWDGVDALIVPKRA